MSAFGVGLVTTTPSGPVQDLGRLGWRLPDQSEEQATHFGYGEGQELHRHDGAV
jgi:hypothetical protein